MKNMQKNAKKLVCSLFFVTVFVSVFLTSAFSSYAASAKVEVGSTSVADSSGYYKIPINVSDVTLSAGKSIDIELSYNNIAFSIAKTEFSSSVKSYVSVSGVNPYHIKITAGSSSLKLSDTVCTVYFKPNRSLEVSDYPIIVTVTGVSASTSSGAITINCTHNYETHSTVAPSCISEGYTLMRCTKCGEYTRSDEKEALGHDYQHVRTVEPSCTQYGYEVQECSRCHLPNIVEGDAPLGHEYGIGKFTVVEPTCTQQGYTEYACLRDGCDNTSRMEYTDMIDHTPGELVVVESTCQKHGSESIYCTQCSLVISEKTLELVPHDFEDTVVEPTCSRSGYTYRKCRECHVERREQPVDKIEHTYTEIVEKQADCISSGRKKFTCTCGASYIEEIPMLGHNYVKVESSDDDVMIGTYVCTECRSERPQVIPVGGTDDGYDSGDRLDVLGEKDMGKLSGRQTLLLNIALIMTCVAALFCVVFLAKATVKKLILTKKG